MAASRLISTPGFVLGSIPYGDTSSIVKVFTRQIGVQGYIVKGARRQGVRSRQALLQPLTCVEMTVYNNPRVGLNHIKEIALRGAPYEEGPVVNALRFYMTEVLRKTLPEGEANPPLWDYVEAVSGELRVGAGSGVEYGQMPVRFFLTVLRHLGLQPMDNHSQREPWFDLQEGRYVGVQTETTTSKELSEALHRYLADERYGEPQLGKRSALLSILIAYSQLHLPSFRHFTSHEVLHGVMR